MMVKEDRREVRKRLMMKLNIMIEEKTGFK